MEISAITEDIDFVDERTDYSKPNMQAAYERNMYRIIPHPPVFDDLQEYIERYMSEKDEQYFEWFLCRYEPIINRIVYSRLFRFGMDSSHFAGLKSACVCGTIWISSGMTAATSISERMTAVRARR